MSTEREAYTNFRRLFYPDGVRNDKAFDELAYILSEGYTDAQVAVYYGVSRKSIANWKRNHEEILKVYKENTSKPDDKVELCLFQRATGYDFVETKVNVVEGNIVKTDIIKHVPPDTTAAIYWLNNRRPAKWRSVVHNTNEDVTPPAFNYDALSPEEMEQYERLLEKITPPQAETE